jgi:hypothetical protein
MKQGALDTHQRASAEVDLRLAAYRPIETDPAIERELRQIIRGGLREQETLPYLPPAPEPVAILSAADRRRPNRRRVAPT